MNHPEETTRAIADPRVWAKSFAVWGLIAFDLALYLWFAYDVGPSFGRIFGRQFLIWGSLGIVTPFVVDYTRDVYRRQAGGAAFMLRHLAGGAVTVICHSIIVNTILVAFGVYRFSDIVASGFKYTYLTLPWQVLSYALIVAFTINSLRKQSLLQRETAHAELERSLKSARLAVLERQLQPHFLFNALNSIAMSCQEDPERATRMIEKLSQLLRRSFSRETESLVPLEEEMGFVEAFLDIQKLRFEERLDADISIDPSLLAIKVPPFAVQTLVENSVKHVVEKSAQTSRIDIQASRSSDEVKIEVTDDGPGLSDTHFEQGTGLHNLRRRLAEMYGERARVEWTSESGRGCVRVLLPLDTEAAGS